MNLLLALAAGAASALMFASIISGAMISLLLFYLAPLPLMVAAIGWGSAGAAIGALVGGLGLSIAFGLALGGVFQFQYFIAFLVTVGIPAVWLGHLTLLAQPLPQTDPSAQEPALEWYPIGRLLVWLALFASAITVIAMLALGWDADSIHEALRKGLARVFAARNSASPSTADTDQMIELMVSIAPAAAAVVSMSILTLNLWLAGRIVATSGRLRRPWPDLHAVELPRLTLLLLAVALALALTGGLLAIVAKIVVAAVLAAHMMVGFAVLHVLTQAVSGRAIWLGLAYASVPLFWWPAIAVALIGLFDDVFRIRQRFTRPPPTLSS